MGVEGGLEAGDEESVFVMSYRIQRSGNYENVAGAYQKRYAIHAFTVASSGEEGWHGEGEQPFAGFMVRETRGSIVVGMATTSEIKSRNASLLAYRRCKCKVRKTRDVRSKSNAKRGYWSLRGCIQREMG